MRSLPHRSNRFRRPEKQITVIRAQDTLPGMAYPYLPTAWDWTIYSTPLAKLEELDCAYPDRGSPTLRIVKDDHITDIHVPHLDTGAFLAYHGLRPSLAKGGYVLSKRLSRLLQPYRFWTFLQPEAVKLVHVAQWESALWDGLGRVSRAFLLAQLLPIFADLPPALRARYEAELRTTKRWEITLMHAGGQEKGDCIVWEDEVPGGAAFAFPAGSAKAELCQTGTVFIGLNQPRHAKVGMRFDPQSVINLYPFLQPHHYLAWLEAESDLFLEALATGRAGAIYSRLGDDEYDLDNLGKWHVAEYLASGGDLRWFSSITRDVGNAHLKRLTQKVEKRLRLPAPGGRFYIAPNAVRGKNPADGSDLARGYAELDIEHATVWVADRDWLYYIVRVLGGCDGDDACWVLPFTDKRDGERKLLLWRSPNQLGEYVVLRPTQQSYEIRWRTADGGYIAWPELDSSLLPPRVDRVDYTYSDLETLDDGAGDGNTAYTTKALDPAIAMARTNAKLLGAYVNSQMLLTALYGKLPSKLPATLETVIDGSVKKPLNLTPVREWCSQSAHYILARRTPVPACLLARLRPALASERRRAIPTSTDHWLDRLVTGVKVASTRYAEAVEALALRATLPAEVYPHLDSDWLPHAIRLRSVYATAVRHRGIDAARTATAAFLKHYPATTHTPLLLAVAIYGDLQRGGGDSHSDALLWQLGDKLAGGGRSPGMAQQFLAVLRDIGLIGEPVWTTEGAVLAYTTESLGAGGTICVAINGTWFNYLRKHHPATPLEMGDVPKALRERVKAHIATLATTRWRGMCLEVRTEQERVVLYAGEHRFGYVQTREEGRLRSHSTWRLDTAFATDGNLHAVLFPV
jgi:hypothetical protein